MENFLKNEGERQALDSLINDDNLSLHTDDTRLIQDQQNAKSQLK